MSHHRCLDEITRMMDYEGLRSDQALLRDRGIYRGIGIASMIEITNPSGVNRRLDTTIDVLHAAKDVNLVALFGPEHGLRLDLCRCRIVGLDGRLDLFQDVSGVAVLHLKCTLLNLNAVYG